MIARVSVVLRRTVCDDIDKIILRTSLHSYMVTVPVKKPACYFENKTEKKTAQWMGHIKTLGGSLVSITGKM